MRQITKMLLGSTGNLTKDTAGLMDSWAKRIDESGRAPIVYAKGDYGWFLYVGESQYYWRDVEIPEDLRLVISKAYKDGCEWIMLDSEEDSIVGLPFYEW